eukprot:m.177333 g.177333  ORF g.177333 m.177333 type:complete len:408 (+) comp14326_c0_seq1:110-1333(+)
MVHSATLAFFGLLCMSHAVTAEWVSGSVGTANWVNAFNRKRCRHNGYKSTAQPLEWSDFLYQAAKDAADANSICSSSDVSFIYLQNSTSATNPSDSTQSYSGFSFHIEPGVSGRDTATKVVDAWYSSGFAQCSGTSGSGLTLPGCIEDASSTSTSTDTSDDDVQYAFMGMISAATRFVGCYRCSEGAADSTSPSFNSLRVICTFKGASDSCSDISNCATCGDWEEVSCHESLILGVNNSVSDGDCTVAVEALPVLSQPSNATKDDEPLLTDTAIGLIVAACIVFLLVVILLVCKWEWIRVHVFGKHSRKYVTNKKTAQRANAASIRTTMRSVREVQSKRTGSAMRHPATDEIFNPKFSLQESGMAGKSTSALDHLDRRIAGSIRSRGGTLKNRRAKGSDPSIGEAAF